MTKILVIEDEAPLRSEVIDWLALEGYETLEAAEGISGMNMAVQHLPDLIVCDITMPRLDGHGVLLELHSNPATSSIPFIFVTARASYDDMRRGMDLGADDYITKPFSRLEFLQAIQTRLGKKTMLEQQRHHEVEQLQQALAQEHDLRMVKTRLIGMFSHDFRNPLASIMSSNSLLRNYADRMDEKRRIDHYNRIETSVRQLVQMLDDMLVVVQMETGGLEFQAGLVELEPFFQSIVDQFHAIDGDSSRLMYECRFKDTVTADARLLGQIATNLISNAVKYSPQGGEVHILVDGDRSQFVLSVQDEGIGIPEADQTRLFEAFQRASNVGEVRGTGLGLAIVKQAADLHRGTIELESQVGKGTTIRVKIPIQ